MRVREVLKVWTFGGAVEYSKKFYKRLFGLERYIIADWKKRSEKSRPLDISNYKIKYL